MWSVTRDILYVLRKELSAIREHVVCLANLVMDFVSPYYNAGYDIIVTLFSCLTEKRPIDSRLALHPTPILGSCNTRRRKLEKKFAVKIIFRMFLKIYPLLQQMLKLLPSWPNALIIPEKTLFILWRTCPEIVEMSRRMLFLNSLECQHLFHAPQLSHFLTHKGHGVLNYAVFGP